MTPKTRSRLTLLLIAVLFFGSFGLALLLHYSGWEPARTRNHGEFVEPAIDLREIVLRRSDGSEYPWRPQSGVWRVLVVAPEDCGTPCVALIETLYRVWFGEGRHADSLDVLWMGEVPGAAPNFRRFVPVRSDPAVLAALPEPVSALALPVYVLDPSGYLVLRYAPGFDPSGLRKDLYRLIK